MAAGLPVAAGGKLRPDILAAYRAAHALDPNPPRQAANQTTHQTTHLEIEIELT